MKKYIEAPEKRTVSALLGAGILFIPFIFSWFTLRKGHSVLARTLSFSWLFLFVVIIGAQDGTENELHLHQATRLQKQGK